MDRDSILFSQIQEVETKFDNAVLALTFSALALSIQFSPKMGDALPYLLISTWILYLSSGIVGTVRYFIRPKALKWNMHLLEQYKAIEAIETNSHLSYDAPLRIAVHQDRATEAQAMLKDVDDAAPLLLRAQLGLLLLAMTLNIVFASINYVREIESRSAARTTQGSSNTPAGNAQLPLNRPVAQPASSQVDNVSVLPQSRPAQSLPAGASMGQPNQSALPKK